VDFLYEIPLVMEREHLADVVCECLHVPCPKPDLKDWEEMVGRLYHPKHDVTVALVGKYTSLHDAYLSVVEALKHGGIYHCSDVHIKWIESEDINSENIAGLLSDVDGLIVPGGFGSRGIEGMITAITYARENGLPYLGLCLGMQLAIIEFARDKAGIHDAHSIEFDPETAHPVIALMPDQNGITDIGGTLRLGSYPCVLKKDSLAMKLYGKEEIHERHRHRYEVNNEFRTVLSDSGMVFSGLSPDGRIVEMCELPEHPFFIATQAHPEFRSRPNNPHPLFRGFVGAALQHQASHRSVE
jgi:CTP synthase